MTSDLSEVELAKLAGITPEADPYRTARWELLEANDALRRLPRKHPNRKEKGLLRDCAQVVDAINEVWGRFIEPTPLPQNVVSLEAYRQSKRKRQEDTRSLSPEGGSIA